VKASGLEEWGRKEMMLSFAVFDLFIYFFFIFVAVFPF
jgi:hypothetical protein